MVKGLLLRIRGVGLGKPLQISPQMKRGKGTLETVPSDLLRRVDPSERLQRGDSGVRPFEANPSPVTGNTPGGCVERMQCVLGTARRQQPAGYSSGDWGDSPGLLVILAVNIALGISDIPQRHACDFAPMTLAPFVFVG